MNRTQAESSKPGILELRWAYVAFGLIAFIDVLIGVRIFNRLIIGDRQVPTDAPFFLLAILILQLVLMWLYVRLRRLVRRYERLRQLHEQELDFSRQILDAMNEGMLVYGSEGQIVYANRRAAEILARPVSELLGLPGLALVPTDVQSRVNETWQHQWTEDKQEYRVPVQDPAGHVRYVRLVASPHWYQGRVVGSIATLYAEDEHPSSP